MKYIAAVDRETGKFEYGNWCHKDSRKPYDVEPGLSPQQIRVELDREPNRDTERYSGDPANPFTARTEAEIQAEHARKLSQRCEMESMTPVVLASLAVAVRERDSAAWDALSDQQKKAEVTTAAAVWTSMRELFDQGCD